MANDKDNAVADGLERLSHNPDGRALDLQDMVLQGAALRA